MELDTVLCIDTSGSMGDQGMNDLREAGKAFLAEVKQTAKEFNLKENVAVVEFGGGRIRVVQTLTTDYDAIQREIDSLKADGVTPMAEGLLKSRQEIIDRCRVHDLKGGWRISPRLIFITDGKPTKLDREKVIKVANSIHPLWKTYKLPLPIPIVCVGCGNDVDKKLLEEIANITNGMLICTSTLSNGGTIQSSFRRQALLIRFAAKLSYDGEQFLQESLLQEFFEKKDEHLSDKERTKLFKMLRSMLIDPKQKSELDKKGYPAFGARVRRGPDWSSRKNAGNEDTFGVGTVVEHKEAGIIRVEWDTGHISDYRWGAEQALDVKVVEEPREHMKVGISVVRGPHWDREEEDGGIGSVGVVYKINLPNLWVRWPNGNRKSYSYGNSRYEVDLLREGFLPCSEDPRVAEPGRGKSLFLAWGLGGFMAILCSQFADRFATLPSLSWLMAYLNEGFDILRLRDTNIGLPWFGNFPPDTHDV